ncbi:hypothetical protein [Moorena sp. SIO4G3]|uniref:hypothetical protein n=1 Tax=Moorena sp. SIO4G3 TaxID=2607821 RepID=UPI0025EC4BE4|nr:hypothetical protein [Moorena sp. SIO4G3]
MATRSRSTFNLGLGQKPTLREWPRDRVQPNNLGLGQKPTLRKWPRDRVQPSTFNLLPSTFYLLPSTFYLLPSTKQPVTCNL